MRKLGKGTYQVLTLTVIFFLLVGEIFYIETIIRREAVTYLSWIGPTQYRHTT